MSWWRGNVLILGFVSFLADIASEMLYPIMPIFIHVVLGISVTNLGFLEGLAEATASILKVYSGVLTDRTQKRRRWIFAGYFLSAVAKPIIGFATGFALVVTGRLFDRVGKGLRTSPRDALLADSVAPEFRGRAFGLHRGMDTAGAAIGPLIALLLIKVFNEDLHWIFFVAFFPGVLAALLVYLAKETQHSLPDISKTNKWEVKKLPPSFWKLMIILGFFNLANSSDIFILLKFKNVGSSNTNTILSYCGFNLVYALSSPFLGRLSDFWDRKIVMSLGFVLFSFVYFSFYISNSLLGMALGFLVYGVYMAATEGVSKAFAVDLVPSHLKGTALGILGLVVGISTLISSTLAGLLWDHLSPQSPFLIGTVGSLFSALLLSVSKFKKIS